jgi:twinkle protein
VASLIPDSLDFSAYERETEFKAKVRPASEFAADLDAAFTPRPASARRPRMTSTKLRNAIEFRPAEVTCWAGFNGHRKSMFTGQVALDLIDMHERVLLISLEMLPRETLARMCRQATALNAPGIERRREFMRWTDGRLWLFNHVGRVTPQKALAVCRYFADQCKGTHVFIDSMMKVCQSEESFDEQKQLVGELCEMAEQTGMHVHLVAHAKKPGNEGESKPPSKYYIRGSSAISDQLHNVILVWQNKVKRAEAEKREPRPEVMGQHDAMVVIDKQRNGAVEGKFGFFFDDASMRFCDDALSSVEPYVMDAA